MVFIAIHSLQRIPVTPVLPVVDLCPALPFFVVEFSFTQLHFRRLENQSHLFYYAMTPTQIDALP